MQELNYQLFDKASGLPIETLSDGCIREFAQRFDKSCSEMYNEMREAVDKAGVRYMIPGAYIEGTDLKIKCVVKGAMSACAPEYFEKYKDAVKFIKDKKEQNGRIQ